MAHPSVSVVNLGCRVNRVESDRMERDLVAAGCLLVAPDEADVVIVNTCAVTGEAEAKTRKAVRHALGRKRSPRVVATGCAASLHPEVLQGLSERVVVVPAKRDVVPRVLAFCASESVSRDACGAVAQPFRSVRADGAGDDAPESVRPADGAPPYRQARVGVKIQDGCNHRCTYCIVWKARGSERSVGVDEVLDQVRSVEAAGMPEVVLTGVNLGAYHDACADGGYVEIDELIATIMRETAIPQIRLSSIEPMDVTDKLIDILASSQGRVAPYLHLPVQSGCTETLRHMGRPYTAEEFEGLCARIHDAIPAIALSCDLIVGFPGETDEAFEQSLALCERVGFSRMHVFRYSARPGTPAAAMPEQVAPPIMAERSRRARELADRLARADARRRVGTVERAVIEQGARGTLGSFHRVQVDGLAEAGLAAPCIADVAIMGVSASGLVQARVCAPDTVDVRSEGVTWTSRV